MNGKWEYDNGTLIMHNFFLNLDRDILTFPDEALLKSKDKDDVIFGTLKARKTGKKVFVSLRKKIIL